MKTSLLLIVALVFVAGAYFIKRDALPVEVPMPVSQDNSTNTLPSLNKLWEKQQQETAKSTKTSVVEPEKEKKTIINAIDKLKPDEIVTKPIPTPDELWEQQKAGKQDDSDSFLPSDTPEIPVISQEQMQAEAEALINAQYGNVEAGEELPDDPDNLDNISRGEELPASEDFLEVMSFEMIESEASNKMLDQQSVVSEYQEPLIDPQTGLSDQELMSYQSDGPAIESEFPVEEFNARGE